MIKMRMLTTRQAVDWKAVLEQCVPYDFYHLPEYHIMAEEEGEGAGCLFVHSEGPYTVALPLLLRDLESDVLALGDAKIGKDATSVYGYAGPLCSHQEMPEAVIRDFQSSLKQCLCDLGVISVFSRLHPFFNQHSLLAGLGECEFSRTVAIDLTQPVAEQRSKFRRAYREGINKLRRQGLTVTHDCTGEYLGEFVRIYHQNMQRVEAAQRYLFSGVYVERLWRNLGSHIHHFICFHEGEALCAGLFMTCHGIIQYHLGGTGDGALKLAPMKLLVDEVRLWGSNEGYRALHLGGGATSEPDDSLLHYKRGFSDRTLEFATWRWIVAPDVYHRLCAARDRWNEQHMLKAAISSYFPAYRSAVVPCFPVTEGTFPDGRFEPDRIATGEAP